MPFRNLTFEQMCHIEVINPPLQPFQSRDHFLRRGSNTLKSKIMNYELDISRLIIIYVLVYNDN